MGTLTAPQFWRARVGAEIALHFIAFEAHTRLARCP
jgi:hypothetical protein